MVKNLKLVMWLFFIGVSIFQKRNYNEWPGNSAKNDDFQDLRCDTTPLVAVTYLMPLCLFLAPLVAPSLYLVTLYFSFFLLSLPFVLLHLHRVNILPYSSQTLTTFVLVLLPTLSFVPPSLSSC